MKKTFISFIVAMSIAIYSMCGFAVFADVVPNEGGTCLLYTSIWDRVVLPSPGGP